MKLCITCTSGSLAADGPRYVSSNADGLEPTLS
jgi:hypothetical protein